ncbi:MAG: translation initiation factor IF-2 [Candidatus Roizmanbacteria bacterium]|nr:MAG: translation initiation factor IF-2 [Candidatus Roizmanbacteria bacterium]
MKPRPPVVTILGHVDHGKTTLLDYIRKSRIAQKEHGGITQKIGAYEISLPIKGYTTNKITFIDTPGHEAFSQLRARGANVADIAILIIDAKDSIMPQTVESISHIKNAQIPFIVALNKVDLPEANPNRVKNDLMKYEIITEDKGGKVPAVEISAKTGKGVDELLETILFVASDLNLQYDPTAAAEAYIIETKKDKRGIAASSIIKNGTLKVGQDIYIYDKKTKIRSLINDLGKTINEVIPSMPFEFLGLPEMPDVGSEISTISTQPQAEEIKKPEVIETLNMAELLRPEKEKEEKISIILKTESQGSLEAIINTLGKNENINIILSAIGNIHRSDVFLAKTTKSIIVGFNAEVNNEIKELAKQEKIIIKTYSIIYELLEELGEVADLLKEKEVKERILKGEAKNIATFIIEGEKIYGVKITKGKINLEDNIEVLRSGSLIGKTKLISLKHRAKAVTEIKKDQEAGMIFNPPLDIKVGDMIQSIL